MAMRRMIPLALAGSCGCFFALLGAPTVAAWRQQRTRHSGETCDDPVCAWCADVTDVEWADDEGGASTAARGPFVLATALALTAEGTSEAAAVGALLDEADGNVRILRAAYGGGMALTAELPDDGNAHDTLDLLTKTLRAAVSRGRADALAPARV